MARSVRRLLLPTLSALVLAGLAAPAATQQYRILEAGQEDYQLHCAACHGPEGRGDGTLAEILTVPPADLVRISRNHDGVFPFWRTYAIIDGIEPVRGHDTFQMPLGRERFGREEAEPGALPAYLRVLQLTHYLEPIQGE